MCIRDRVYVANSNSNNVSIINTANNNVTATIPVGIFPEGVAITPDGTKVYVTNYNGNTVSVINTATNNVTAIINVGQQSSGIAVTPDGTKAVSYTHLDVYKRQQLHQMQQRYM